jgi:hypothetical protein
MHDDNGVLLDAGGTQKPADNGEGTYILLPVLDEPDAWLAVFSDGSYTRWIPRA